MTFPPSERVLYRNNPLQSVISQVRFPPILRIDAEAPAGFQEAVRADYPRLSEPGSVDAGLPIPPEIARGLPAAVLQQFVGFRMSVGPANRTYSFESADGGWTISLARDAMALSAVRYLRWEEFERRMSQALVALNNAYGPAEYSRIGLRYQNLILRSRLGLDGVPWGELLEAPIAGELADPSIGRQADLAARQLRVPLAEGQGTLLLQHGIAKGDGDEIGYAIDADLFIDHATEVNHAGESLEYLHTQAGGLFRWCIQDRLHEALGPEPVRD